MKSSIYILFLAFLPTVTLFSQADICSRQTNFGAAEICLPNIDGYQECYLDPMVKPMADATEVEINMVLGYYLNNVIHQKRDSLGFISFGDYFKLYGTKQIQDYEANRAILLDTKKSLEGNFFKTNWDEVEKEVDKLGAGLKVGVPVVLNSYSLNDDSFSIVMLIKYEIEGSDAFTMAMTVNGLLIDKRLIWMAYYLKYEGESTITELENNSNVIVEKILSGNK